MFITKEYLDECNGYMMHCLHNHPLFPGKTKEKRSRIVMAEYINRMLEINEVVHHKNENKVDDRIENLQLMTDEEHRAYHASKREVSEETKIKMSISAMARNYEPEYNQMLSDRATKQWEDRREEMESYLDKARENKPPMTEEQKEFHSNILKEHIKSQSSEEMARRSSMRDMDALSKRMKDIWNQRNSLCKQCGEENKFEPYQVCKSCAEDIERRYNGKG